MIPTVQQVYTGARSVLGDNQDPDGEVFTDAILEPHYQSAYEELFRALSAAQNPLVIHRAYYNVPINTGFLDPLTLGVENLGQIISLAERGNITAWAVSNAVAGSAICTLTSAATSLATGNQAILYGVQGLAGDINDAWTVTVLSPTSTVLNGCTATGAYTSGGVLSTSAEKFQELTATGDFEWEDQAPTSRFAKYCFERGIIRVPPCGNIRQLKLNYMISGNAPLTLTASTGIDDSLEFFKYRVAGMAGPSKGMLERSKGYTYMAVGPKWETEQSPGGILGNLLMGGVRNLQRLPPSLRRTPPWRDHRWRAVW